MKTARHVQSTAGVVVYRSGDRPENGPVPAAEVFACERCDGEGEISGSYGGDGYGDRCCGVVDYEAVCPECRGAGLLHGYDSNGRGLPVAVEALQPAVRAAS